MADFTLPARPKRRTSQAPTLPISALPGRGETSQSGVEGFLTRLPAGMGAGTPAYQAGLDQSRGGQLAAGLPEVQDQVATAQAQSLQEHKAYREGLQATQQQVDTRNKDLKLVENLLIATDPGTDKAVRKFMLQGISNAVGVDPKGEYSQGLQKMVLGMAPEGLEALRSSFSDDIKNSPPGAIHAKLGAMFSGDIPVENVIGQVKEHQEARAEAARGLTHPGVPLTSGTTPDIAGAETTAELAGGAATGSAAAPPSGAQRQQIIQAAGLSDAPTAQLPAEAAPTAPEEPSISAPPPDIPLPETIDPQSLEAPAPAAPTPVEPEVPAPPPPAAPAPQAQPVAPLSDAPTATTPPTAATPPPDPGKLEVTPEMRQAAEQSGDKLLLKAIDLLDQRNAAIDSATIHRKSQERLPGAPGGTSSDQIGPGRSEAGKAPVPATAPAATTPAGAPTAKSVGQRILEALPVDPITGNKPSDVFSIDPKNDKVTTTDPDAPPPQKLAAGAMTTASAPAGPKVDDPTPNTWIAASNEQARRTPLPKTDNLRWVKEEERAPHEQELRGGIKGLLEGVNPDPSVRTTVGDVATAYPKVGNTAADEKRIQESASRRDAALLPLVTPSTNVLRIVNAGRGEDVMGSIGKAAIPKAWEHLKGIFGQDTKGMEDAVTFYGSKVDAALAKDQPNLTSKERNDRATYIGVNLAILEYGVLKAQNPDGKFSDKDRLAARAQIGSLSNTTSELNILIKNHLEMGIPSANQGFASETGNSKLDLRGIPREERDRWLDNYANLPDDRKATVNPDFIKNVMATNRQEDDRKAGKPSRENEYLVSRGGNRPEDYERVKQKELTTVESRAEAQEGRKVSEEGRHVRAAELAEESHQMKKDQVAENNRRYEETKARQAQQDAAHQQEKMAAAFSRIGAMIAGSVRGISGGGGSGISAGGEDSSAFRIAPMPQRAAPRVAPATGITRYGGPIKKNQ